jgi:hypothetical protein
LAGRGSRSLGINLICQNGLFASQFLYLHRYNTEVLMQEDTLCR